MIFFSLMSIIYDMILRHPIYWLHYHVFTDADVKHVMISYNWGCQEQMIMLRDKLRAAGYKVWMDVDSLGKYFPRPGIPQHRGYGIH